MEKWNKHEKPPGFLFVRSQAPEDLARWKGSFVFINAWKYVFLNENFLLFSQLLFLVSRQSFFLKKQKRGGRKNVYSIMRLPAKRGNIKKETKLESDEQSSLMEEVKGNYAVNKLSALKDKVNRDRCSNHEGLRDRSWRNVSPFLSPFFQKLFCFSHQLP